MNGAALGLVVSVFLACAVEAVEAFTIVLAVGHTRSWPSALSGAVTAACVLAAVVAGLGSAITTLPIEDIRLAIGLLLLLFGLYWLRKAVLRAAGLKALRDERIAYARESAAAASSVPGRRRGGWDPYSFVISLKGVLIEGLEVALIAVTFGADHHRIGLAAAAAGLAVLCVLLAGLAARAPLAHVPENTMKFAVGVMLCSYGVFWAGEGAGMSWPGGDAVLLAIIPSVLLASLAAVLALRERALG